MLTPWKSIKILLTNGESPNRENKSPGSIPTAPTTVATHPTGDTGKHHPSADGETWGRELLNAPHARFNCSGTTRSWPLAVVVWCLWINHETLTNFRSEFVQAEGQKPRAPKLTKPTLDDLLFLGDACCRWGEKTIHFLNFLNLTAGFSRFGQHQKLRAKSQIDATLITMITLSSTVSA